MDSLTDFGFVGYTKTLSVERLVWAYQHGVFPWPTGEPHDPVGWFSPSPRALLSLNPEAWSRSVRRAIRNHRFEARPDTAVRAIIEGCARAPRRDQGGTWIHSAVVDAYVDLHEAGWAHALGVWQEDQLVGGVYGVAIGRVFCGESMFGLVNNASKVALGALLLHLRAEGFTIMDAQIPSPHMQRWGLHLVSREAYLQTLAEHGAGARPGPRWTHLRGSLDDPSTPGPPVGG